MLVLQSSLVLLHFSATVHTFIPSVFHFTVLLSSAGFCKSCSTVQHHHGMFLHVSRKNRLTLNEISTRKTVLPTKYILSTFIAFYDSLPYCAATLKTKMLVLRNQALSMLFSVDSSYPANFHLGGAEMLFSSTVCVYRESLAIWHDIISTCKCKTLRWLSSPIVGYNFHYTESGIVCDIAA